MNFITCPECKRNYDEVAQSAECPHGGSGDPTVSEMANRTTREANRARPKGDRALLKVGPQRPALVPPTPADASLGPTPAPTPKRPHDHKNRGW